MLKSRVLATFRRRVAEHRVKMRMMLTRVSSTSTPSMSAFGSCISPKKDSSSSKEWNAPKGMDLRKEMEEKLQSNPKFLEMQKIRRQLPVTKFREKVLKTVASSQVTLISAQTGAGKTTQVPQFLLEELGEK